MGCLGAVLGRLGRQHVSVRALPARGVSVFRCRGGGLGASWRRLGAVLGRLGAVLECLVAVLGRFGTVLARLGPSWGHLGAVLGAVLERSGKLWRSSENAFRPIGVTKIIAFL